MNTQKIVQALRDKESRDNRALLDAAANEIERLCRLAALRLKDSNEAWALAIKLEDKANDLQRDNELLREIIEDLKK